MTAAAARSNLAAGEPDRLEGFSAPREVDRLYGHAAARAEFAEARRGGRLHHAWMLAGPEGVGKATLAYHLAREVLAEAEGASPQSVFRKVAALSHPNLLLLRRSWNEKQKRYSQFIGVDEVRRLRSFLGHSAGEGGWRVVIVDRADELNANAANALLKALEEPPPRTVFFLVVNAEGQIPVTIRSRCRIARLGALMDGELREAVAAALARDGHQADEAALATALELSEGSVRRALELLTGDGIDLYRELLGIFLKLPELDAVRLHRLAEGLGGAAQSERFELFYSLLLGLLERLIRASATGETPIAEERLLAAKLIGHQALPHWVEAWEAIGAAKADASSLNLDRGLLVLQSFARLQEVARANPV